MFTNCILRGLSLIKYIILMIKKERKRRKEGRMESNKGKCVTYNFIHGIVENTPDRRPLLILLCMDENQIYCVQFYLCKLVFCCSITSHS